jgi:hypothetical protein
MKYQTLMQRCKCGRPTTRLRNVGFTADHQLVLHLALYEMQAVHLRSHAARGVLAGLSEA